MKMLKGRFLFTGFTDEERLVITRVIPRGSFKDGKPTGENEAVRISAMMQGGGEINFDLCPFSKEKMERCQKYFGCQFSISNLVGVEDCKVFIYKDELRMTVTAADLQLQSDPWKEVVEL